MILYEEKPSKKSFVPLAVFCIVFISLAIYMRAPLVFFLIPLAIIIAIFSLLILGSEFRLEDDFIFMKTLFIPRKISYSDISKIELAEKYKDRGLSLSVQGIDIIGNKNRYNSKEFFVKTESGEIFKPDEYSSSGQNGVVLYTKTGRMFFSVKDVEKVKKLIQQKIKAKP